MSRSSMLRSLVVLALVFAGCGDGSEAGDEPTTLGDESSATTGAAQSAPETEGEAEPVPSTEGTRDPSDLTQAPEQVTPAPPPVEVTPPEPEPSPGEESPAEPDPGEPLPVLPDPKVPRALESLVALARADLARVVGVAEAEIGVAVAETIVWPDGGLGCPEPGMAYTQVQVEGYRIVLTHGGASYAYHGGGNRPDPFLCRNPSFPLD